MLLRTLLLEPWGCAVHALQQHCNDDRGLQGLTKEDEESDHTEVVLERHGCCWIGSVLQG